MFIVYFIFLLLAITFKVLHWPGVSLFLLITPLFGLVDIVIQAIRNKGDKETNILSAVALLFLALFFQFKFLSWPGSFVLFFLSATICLVFIFRFITKKRKKSLRFYLLVSLFLFSIVNVSLKNSQFTLLYMLEDPFDKNQAVPHFIIQRLAFSFYQEGNHEKAKRLIERNIDHLEALISNNKSKDFYQKIDSINLEISINDLQKINLNNWKNLEPLIPEDRQEP